MADAGKHGRVLKLDHGSDSESDSESDAGSIVGAASVRGVTVMSRIGFLDISYRLCNQFWRILVQI